MREHQDDLRTTRELELAAKDWQRERHGSEMGFLMTGVRLARADDWLRNNAAPPLVREFINRSLEAVREETVREERARHRRRADGARHQAFRWRAGRAAPGRGGRGDYRREAAYVAKRPPTEL